MTRAVAFWLVGLLVLGAILAFVEVIDAMSAALAVLDAVAA